MNYPEIEHKYAIVYQRQETEAFSLHFSRPESVISRSRASFDLFFCFYISRKGLRVFTLTHPAIFADHHFSPTVRCKPVNLQS
jgi:hypothetical protein